MLRALVQDVFWGVVLHFLSTNIATSNRIVFVMGSGCACSRLGDLIAADSVDESPKQDVIRHEICLHDRSTASHFQLLIQLKELCNRARPTLMHLFMKRLSDAGKLLRLYTQNVDGAEVKAGMGMLPGKLVMMHGNIHVVACSNCHAQSEWTTEVVDAFRSGRFAYCRQCEQVFPSNAAARMRRKTAYLRSNVLYDMHAETLDNLVDQDVKSNPDMLVIVDTSLPSCVCGIKDLITHISNQVHKTRGQLVIYVNSNPPPQEYSRFIDIYIGGSGDEFVEEVVKTLRELKPEDWEHW